MYGAFLSHSIVADGFQAFHGSRIVNAHLLCHIVHAVYAAIPHNIFNVDIVAHQRLDIVVDIDNTYQSIAVLSEIVEKRRVLTKRIITVIGKIARRLVISEEDNNAAFHKFFKLSAAVYIRLFVKHF